MIGRPLDAAQSLTMASLRSDIIIRVVAAGGGMQAVIDATGLRTLENFVGLIDPAILAQAFDNDVLQKTQPPPV